MKRVLNEERFKSRVLANIAKAPEGIEEEAKESLIKGYCGVGYPVADHPRIQAIELTNVCNLECIMCPYPTMTRAKGFMPLSLLHTITTRDMPVKQTVELQMFGESCLHPEIDKAIAVVKGNGHTPVLSTNATTLGSKVGCEKLLGLDMVVLSVDGISEEVYNRVRVGSKFEDIVKAVRMFCTVNKAHGSPVYTVIQLIDMKATESELAGYLEFWGNFGANEVRVKHLLDSMAGEVMLEEVAQPKKRIPCGEILNSVAVRWNGEVSPCCRDFNGKVTLGNLQNESLQSVWNGAAARQLRLQHLNEGELPKMCAGCREFDLINLRSVYALNNTHFKGADVRVNDVIEEVE